MAHLKIVLSAELARVLNQRATRLHRTPDELVSALLTYWLVHARELQPLRKNESVQDRFAMIAERYVEISRELLEDDPDLGLDVTIPSGDDECSHASERRRETSTASTDEMTEQDIQRVFADIAEHYTEICREALGDDPVLSGGHDTGRYLYAYDLPIQEKSRGAGWPALAARINQLLQLDPERPDTLSHRVIHVRVPAGESIDGPTLLYVDPELAAYADPELERL